MSAPRPCHPSSGLADVSVLRRKADAHDRVIRQMRSIADDAERRRWLAEAESAKQRALTIEAFARDLLPVVDDLAALTGDRGRLMSQAALSDALVIVEGRLLDVFRQHGITPIEATVGDAFDSRCHEALWVVESATSEPNRLAQIVERGYRLHGRLLRPTRVAVTARPGAERTNAG